MTKTEKLVTSLMGRPLGKKEEMFVEAVDLLGECLAGEGAFYDTILRYDVYPQIAEKYQILPTSVYRSIDRAANQCWDFGNRPLLDQVIGRRLSDIGRPSHLLFYVAYYLYLDGPYYG